ncbi:MAG: hypothetical protein AAF251_07455 [Pseudomonadota bacterium]
MRTRLSITALALTTVGLAACDVQQTKEGEMPDVDVSVDAGNLPEYEVDAPELKIGTTETEVEVPDVEVTTKTETIDVPVIGIESGDVKEDIDE